MEQSPSEANSHSASHL